MLNMDLSREIKGQIVVKLELSIIWISRVRASITDKVPSREGSNVNSSLRRLRNKLKCFGNYLRFLAIERSRPLWGWTRVGKSSWVFMRKCWLSLPSKIHETNGLILATLVTMICTLRALNPACLLSTCSTRRSNDEKGNKLRQDSCGRKSWT